MSTQRNKTKRAAVARCIKRFVGHFLRTRKRDESFVVGIKEQTDFWFSQSQKVFAEAQSAIEEEDWDLFRIKRDQHDLITRRFKSAKMGK